MSNPKKAQYRLTNIRYSEPGFYFVTICSWKWAKMFGNVRNCQVDLSEIGEIIKRCWLEIPSHFNFVFLDEFVIMPDHMHGIIEIRKNDGSGPIGRGFDSKAQADSKAKGASTDGQLTVGTSRKGDGEGNGDEKGKGAGEAIEYRRGFVVDPKSLSVIIRTFKAAVTTEVRRKLGKDKVWKNRFHDRVLRQDELEPTRQYIQNNPWVWQSEVDQGLRQK